jgi:hypothetical protein
MLDRITGGGKMAKKARKKSSPKRKKKKAAPARRKRKAAIKKRKAARRAKPAPKRKGIIGTIVGAASAVVDTLADAERTHRKLEPHVPPDPE